MKTPPSRTDAGSDVTPPVGFKGALARLGSVQKSSRGGPAYSIFVNRRLGRVAAAFAYQLGMTPNAVTVVSALCSFVAIAMIALASSVVASVLVAVLLALGYVLDAADGQLARLRGGGSLSGEWLDHVVDAVKIVSLHLAVVVHLYRFTDLGDVWILVPMGFCVVAVTLFFAQLLNDQLRRHRGVESASDLAGTREAPSIVASLAKLPHDYGVLCWAFVLLAWPTAFLVVYGLLFVANSAYLAAGLTKWFLEIRAIDAKTRS